jgi:hypothetical protein
LAATLCHLALAALLAPLAPAADFGFSAIIRAGMPNHADWELGLGPSGNNSASTANLNPYFPNNQPRQFQIGYNAASRTGYLRYFHSNSSSQTVSFTTPFVTSPSTMLRWEIPVGGLYARAASRNRPTGVFVENLALSGAGLNILQPLTVSSLSASQNGAGQSTNLPGPIVFRASASSNWLLSGTIRFQGLGDYVPGGARRSELHLGFSGDAFVESPEPLPAALTGAGLVLFATLRSRKSSRHRRSPRA